MEYECPAVFKSMESLDNSLMIKPAPSGFGLPKLPSYDGKIDHINMFRGVM